MPFNRNYGYIVLYNGQTSPAGRPVANKLHQIRALELDSKGRIVLVVNDQNSSARNETEVFRILPTGVLDPDFGNGAGWVGPNINQPSVAGSVAATSKSEVAGTMISWDSSLRYYVPFTSSVDATNTMSVMMRISESGQLDTTFGSSSTGYFLTSTGGVSKAGGTAENIGFNYIPSTGMLLGFGFSKNSSAKSEFITAMYSVSGSPVSSYGASSGYTIFQPGGDGSTGAPNASKSDASRTNYIQDSSGRLYGLGVQCPDWNGSATGGSVSPVVRFTASGAVDTSFGPYGTGIAEIPAHGTTGLTGRAFGSKFDLAIGSIFLDSQGRIYSQGYSFDANGAYQAVIYRWTTSGSLDSTFGTGGIAYFNLNGVSVAALGTTTNKYENFNSAIYDPALDRIIATGSSGITTDGRPILVRFKMDGTLDTAFGNGYGYKILSPPDRPTEAFGGATGTFVDSCSNIRIDYLGRYVLGCYTKNSSGGTEPFVLRTDSTGRIDY